MRKRSTSRRRVTRRVLRVFGALGAAVALLAWGVHGRTPPLPEGPPPPGTVRVVTYNIRAGLGGLDGIARDLIPWEADAIALQEVERGIARSRSADQPGDLGAALDREPIFAGSFRVGGGEHGVAILSRHPIGETRTIDLPRGSGKWPRVALAARIDVPDAPFLLVCIHLSRPWGWPLSNTATRLAQLDELIRLLEDEPLPVVIAGDFNAFPISVEALSAGRLWETSWKPWRDGWATTFPLRAVGLPGGGVKIDQVWHDRRWESAGHWVAPPGASDHRAVIVDLIPTATR